MEHLLPAFLVLFAAVIYCRIGLPRFFAPYLTAPCLDDSNVGVVEAECLRLLDQFREVTWRQGNARSERPCPLMLCPFNHILRLQQSFGLLMSCVLWYRQQHFLEQNFCTTVRGEKLAPHCLQITAFPPSRLGEAGAIPPPSPVRHQASPSRSKPPL